MIRSLFRLHYMALVAVVGSLLASLLLFLIGAYHVYEAFLIFLGLRHPIAPGKENVEAVATALESFDNFMIGFILLYFAYSLYFLVTFPEEREKLGRVKMPPAFEVASLGEMKRTILTVVVVSLSVFMLREVFLFEEGFQLTDFFIPVSIIAVAIALKLIKFD